MSDDGREVASELANLPWGPCPDVALRQAQEIVDKALQAERTRADNLESLWQSSQDLVRVELQRADAAEARLQEIEEGDGLAQAEIEKMQASVRELEAERERLMAALQRYASREFWEANDDGVQPCNSGPAVAIAALAEQPGERAEGQ